MKLLLAAHSLEGLAGAPIHTLDLCRGFRRVGHEVSVFTFYPGVVANILQEEGFAVLTVRDHRLLEDEPFDIVYLFHATCEALLGLVFAGRTPIVRGYIGKGSATADPINANFSSAVTYISEGVRETMQGKEGWNSAIPSRIARNVYDDALLVEHGVEVQGRPPKKPAFALVSNHAPSQLVGLLEKAAGDGLCRFTTFGQPDNSVLITPELLEPFDAVITVGRTVLLSAAMGKPSYLCDIHGTEGWLVRGNYEDARLHSFSGRRSTVEDWRTVERHLLDTDRWPDTGDLTRVRERIAHDHALFRRVGELGALFAEIISKAPPPMRPPDGHRAMFRLLLEDNGARLPGRNHRRLEFAKALNAAEQKISQQASRLRETRELLARCRERLRESDRKLQKERATTRGLKREIADLYNPAGGSVLWIVDRLRGRARR